VLRPDPAYEERYRRDPYGSYVVTGKLRFPVDAMPPPGVPPMTRMMAWRPSAAVPWQVSPLEESSEPRGAEILYAFWFAWYATHEGQPRAKAPQVPIALLPGSLGRSDLNAPGRINADTPMGPIEARYEALGTRTKQGEWIWAWTDPSVPRDVRVGPEAPTKVPRAMLDPSWNPRPGDIERIVLAAATELRAVYFGEVQTVVGSRYVLLFEPLIFVPVIPYSPPPQRKARERR
jgi:hypothetical protein